MEDFNGYMPYDMMLRLMDRYPLKVPVLAGELPFRAQHLYITSATWPDTWWLNYDHAAFYRRCDEIVWFRAPGDVQCFVQDTSTGSVSGEIAAMLEQTSAFRNTRSGFSNAVVHIEDYDDGAYGSRHVAAVKPAIVFDAQEW